MNRNLLRQYAEAGVVKRLQDIQAELEALHAEFPHLVANANGTIPAVVPMEAKKRGNGWGGKRTKKAKTKLAKRAKTAEVLADIQRYLRRYKEATIPHMATDLGVARTTIRHHLLKNRALFVNTATSDPRHDPTRYSLAVSQ